MSELARAVVDLNRARLGRVRDAGDVHCLAAGRDRVLDRLGLGLGRCRRGRGAAADGDALDVDAEVRGDSGGLRDVRLSGERDLNGIRSATAIELRVAEHAEDSVVGVVLDVDL